MRIAVNGCGRIGKTFIRALLQDKKAREQIELAVINVGPGDRETIAYALQYDTLLGTYLGTLEYADGILTVDGSLKVTIVQVLDPEKAPWRELNIDWVVECSGRFTDREGAEKHLKAGAQKVLISAPANGEDVTIIPGVNQELYSSDYTIVSLGSCTTNAIYPMLKVLKESFGIDQALMTTTHAYTNTQALLDVDPRVKDPRRSRAAALNIIPTTTGAMKMVDKVMPDLVGKLEGGALRVPVGKVSIIDLVACLSKKATADEVNEAFKKAAQGEMKGIICYGNKPLVSSDYAGNPHSVIVDTLLTRTLGSSVKVFGGYDNEWGYSERLKDFLLMTLK